MIFLGIAWPTKYSLNFVILGALLGGANDHDALRIAFQNSKDFRFAILFYGTGAILLGVILGVLFKALVRNLKWDREFKLFRFQNEWHYLFSGEILDFPRVQGRFEDVNMRIVDALVETSEDPYIYMGILADYILKKDGGLLE